MQAYSQHTIKNVHNMLYKYALNQISEWGYDRRKDLSLPPVLYKELNEFIEHYRDHIQYGLMYMIREYIDRGEFDKLYTVNEYMLRNYVYINYSTEKIEDIYLYIKGENPVKAYVNFTP